MANNSNNKKKIILASVGAVAVLAGAALFTTAYKSKASETNKTPANTSSGSTGGGSVNSDKAKAAQNGALHANILQNVSNNQIKREAILDNSNKDKPITTTANQGDGGKPVIPVETAKKSEKDKENKDDAPLPTVENDTTKKPIDVPESESVPPSEVKDILDPETVMNADFGSYDNDNYKLKKLKTSTAEAIIFGKRVEDSDVLFNKQAASDSVREELGHNWERVFFLKDADKTMRYRLLVFSNSAHSTDRADNYPLSEADFGSFLYQIIKNADGLFKKPIKTIKSIFADWGANKTFKNEGRFVLIREDVSTLPPSEQNAPQVLELVPPTQIISKDGDVADASVYKIDHVFGKENVSGHLFRVSNVDDVYPQSSDFKNSASFRGQSKTVEANGRKFKVIVKTAKGISNKHVLDELTSAIARNVERGDELYHRCLHFFNADYNKKPALSWFKFESSSFTGSKIDASFLVIPMEETTKKD